VNSSGIRPPKRFSIVRILVTGALLVLAGKGAIVGYGLAKEAVEPAPLAKGDCISFDASGANPHVSSCGEIHFGEVVKEVKASDECAGITDFWIQKKDRYYCIRKTG
jgi:hypothetical protein